MKELIFVTIIIYEHKSTIEKQIDTDHEKGVKCKEKREKYRILKLKRIFIFCSYQ